MKEARFTFAKPFSPGEKVHFCGENVTTESDIAVRVIVTSLPRRDYTAKSLPVWLYFLSRLVPLHFPHVHSGEQRVVSELLYSNAHPYVHLSPLGDTTKRYCVRNLRRAVGIRGCFSANNT